MNNVLYKIYLVTNSIIWGGYSYFLFKNPTNLDPESVAIIFFLIYVTADYLNFKGNKVVEKTKKYVYTTCVFILRLCALLLAYLYVYIQTEGVTVVSAKTTIIYSLIFGVWLAHTINAWSKKNGSDPRNHLITVKYLP